MLTMDKIHDIRFRFYEKGEKIAQIAKALELDRRTVQKFVDKKDFNEPHPKAASEQSLCPKLEPYKSTIDSWLEEDKQAPRKQRHTAKRVFDRLRQEIEGFNCSYRTVAAYYAVKHKEIFSGTKEGFLPLEHKPGEVVFTEKRYPKATGLACPGIDEYNDHKKERKSIPLTINCVSSTVIRNASKRYGNYT